MGKTKIMAKEERAPTMIRNLDHLREIDLPKIVLLQLVGGVDDSPIRACLWERSKSVYVFYDEELMKYSISDVDDRISIENGVITTLNAYASKNRYAMFRISRAEEKRLKTFLGVTV